MSPGLLWFPHAPQHHPAASPRKHHSRLGKSQRRVQGARAAALSAIPAAHRGCQLGVVGRKKLLVLGLQAVPHCTRARSRGVRGGRWWLMGPAGAG